MKTLTDQLSQYAEYHRHPRNIATHFLGIPLIVAAVVVLLSRPSLEVAGLVASPAVVVALAALGFYFLLDVGMGIIMSMLLGLAVWFGAWSAAQSTGVWLALGVGVGVGVGGFVLGWVLQFIGHYYEGRKPAFVDDMVGLLIGPLFVVAEALFLLGLRPKLKSAIEARAGTMRSW